MASIKRHKLGQFQEAVKIEKNGQLNKRNGAINLSGAWKTTVKKNTI